MYKVFNSGDSHLIVSFSQYLTSFGFIFNIEVSKTPIRVSLNIKILFWDLYLEVVRWSPDQSDPTIT